MEVRPGTLRRALRDRSGIAASEFALALPVLTLMLFSLYDVSNALWRRTRLEMAARAGAQYAFSRPQDSAGIASVVRGQLAGWTDITVAPATMSCKCDNGTAADCTTGLCQSGAVVNAPIGYVSITVTQPYRYASPITAALFPSLATLRGNAELRVH
ncbi:TadE/TadG family type IV pilus assembly protein [Roseomonas sp. WA12]